MNDKSREKSMLPRKVNSAPTDCFLLLFGFFVFKRKINFDQGNTPYCRFTFKLEFDKS